MAAKKKITKKATKVANANKPKVNKNANKPKTVALKAKELPKGIVFKSDTENKRLRDILPTKRKRA